MYHLRLDFMSCSTVRIAQVSSLRSIVRGFHALVLEVKFIPRTNLHEPKFDLTRDQLRHLSIPTTASNIPNVSVVTYQPLPAWVFYSTYISPETIASTRGKTKTSFTQVSQSMKASMAALSTMPSRSPFNTNLPDVLRGTPCSFYKDYYTSAPSSST